MSCLNPDINKISFYDYLAFHLLHQHPAPLHLVTPALNGATSMLLKNSGESNYDGIGDKLYNSDNNDNNDNNHNNDNNYNNYNINDHPDFSALVAATK